jgi:hypothetical protein
MFADGSILQHVPASRDGKQRRQAAALHRRVAAERLARNGRHYAKHQRRVRLASPAEDKSPLECAVSSAATLDAAIF